MKPRWVAVFIVTALLSTAASARAQLQGKGDSSQETIDNLSRYADQMEKFLFVVDHLTRTSDNATSSAVAAALQVNEVLKDKPQDAIDYFNRVLPDVKNDSVRRVIRLQLAELYRRTNQPEKSLDQLRELMVLAPAGTPAHAAHAAPARPSAPARNERKSDGS